METKGSSKCKVQAGKGEGMAWGEDASEDEDLELAAEQQQGDPNKKS